jgi:hypothetical protein
MLTTMMPPRSEANVYSNIFDKPAKYGIPYGDKLLKGSSNFFRNQSLFSQNYFVFIIRVWMPYCEGDWYF